MVRILSITTSRADLGHLIPVWRALTDEGFDLQIGKFGSHEIPESWQDHVSYLMTPPGTWDQPNGIVMKMGIILMAVADAYQVVNPDLLLVLGDRYEMAMATAGALPFKIPVAHIQAGEETIGAFDNQYRNAMSAMSHILFTPTARAYDRVIRQGAEPWRVHNVGTPGLDNMVTEYSMVPAVPYVLVVCHPETLSTVPAEDQVEALCDALAESAPAAFIIGPNQDTQAQSVFDRRLREFVEVAGRSFPLWYKENLPRSQFLGLLEKAACLVGNSSAGMIEAPAFHVPVVNIGWRQRGRPAYEGVLNVPDWNGSSIGEAVKAARTQRAIQLAKNGGNPYGGPGASAAIAQVLKELPSREELLLRGS